MWLATFLCTSWAPDPSFGGNHYLTSHAQQAPIARADYHLEPEIKEFHIHVYFSLFEGATACPHCNASYVAAERLRQQILAAVTRREFVAVCAGATAAMLPGLNESATYPVNLHPQGPHPAGSYEVWAPKEYFASVLSFMLIHRQELTFFFHPLSAHAVEDHVGRSTFFGPPMRLNLNDIEDDGDPPQYAELGLGYSRRAGGAPGQWWHS